MTDRNDVALAKARADARRSMLVGSAKQLASELSPDELRRRAAHEIGQVGRIAARRSSEIVRSHPFALGSIGAAALLILFRKPIGRWLGDKWQPVGGWDVDDDEHRLATDYDGQGDDDDELEEDDNR